MIWVIIIITLLLDHFVVREHHAVELEVVL